jgi:Cellulase (glycosyl hydrolase family 5)
MTATRVLLWLCLALAPAAGATGVIRVNADGNGFVRPDGRAFTPWGVNYDHDRDGRLLEDYWEKEWAMVEQDFREIRALGANTVRVHLQTGRFLDAPDRANPAALARYRDLLALAERTGLLLDVTGLGCYHRKDVPAWYEALPEAERWRAQAVFWSAVAEAGRGSPAIFCYDLMNEPVAPGDDKPVADWLAGEFGGKHFVQYIARENRGRTRAEVARAWVDTLVAAIRKHEPNRLITVGEIPWGMAFRGAKPVFADPAVGRNLDFASIHLYPKAGELDHALRVLDEHRLGKPVVIEEMFPLSCGVEELGEFVTRSRGRAAGWISFYWGATPEELDAKKDDIAAAVTREWLRKFSTLAPKDAP